MTKLLRPWVLAAGATAVALAALIAINDVRGQRPAADGQQWNAYFYNDRQDPFGTSFLGSYASVEDCLAAGRRSAVDFNAPEAGYVCGQHCRNVDATPFDYLSCDRVVCERIGASDGCPNAPPSGAAATP